MVAARRLGLKTVPVIYVDLPLEQARLLNLFLGSGSTMIAAERTGRTCYGMELEPSYVDVAVMRWEAFTGEKATREETE